MAGGGGGHEWYQTIGLDFVDVSAKFVFFSGLQKRIAECRLPIMAIPECFSPPSVLLRSGVPYRFSF